jgi:hypothetical protein
MNLSCGLERICARDLFDTNHPGLTRRNFVTRPDVGLNRPLSIRVAKPGHVRFVVGVDGGAATDDAAARLRTALGAFRKGAERGRGFVREAPRSASRFSVRRTAAPRLTARRCAGAGRGRRAIRRHVTAGRPVIVPAVGFIATPPWHDIADLRGRMRSRNVRYQQRQGGQRDVSQIHA